MSYYKKAEELAWEFGNQTRYDVFIDYKFIPGENLTEEEIRKSASKTVPVLREPLFSESSLSYALNIVEAELNGGYYPVKSGDTAGYIVSVFEVYEYTCDNEFVDVISKIDTDTKLELQPIDLDFAKNIINFSKTSASHLI